MGEPWYVYIIRCSDHSLYTGIAKDVAQRVEAHNAGTGARYTRGRGPVKVVYTEELDSKPEALRREIEIKRLRREDKEALILGD